MNLGRRLKKLRIKNDLTQNDVAQFLSVDRTIVTKYENDALVPNDETLSKLSVLFKVEKNELIYFKVYDIFVIVIFILNITVILSCIAYILFLTLPTFYNYRIVGFDHVVGRDIFYFPCSLLADEKVGHKYANYLAFALLLTSIFVCPFSIFSKNKKIKLILLIVSILLFVVAIILIYKQGLIFMKG